MLIRVFNDPYDTIIKAGDTRKRGEGVRNEVERKEREQARGGGQAGRQVGWRKKRMDGGDPPLMTPPPRTPTSPHRIVNRNGWRKRRLCGSRVGKRLICVGAGGNAGESRKGRMTLGERDLTCQDKLNITVVVWKWWESETGSIGLDRVCVDFRCPLFAEPRLPRQSQTLLWLVSCKDICIQQRLLSSSAKSHETPPSIPSAKVSAPTSH